MPTRQFVVLEGKLTRKGLLLWYLSLLPRHVQGHSVFLPFPWPRGGRPSAPGAWAFPRSLHLTALGMVDPGRFPISWPSGWLTSAATHLPSPLLLSHRLGFCLAEEMESSHRKCWASSARGAESVFSVDAGANGPLPAHASCCPSLGKGSDCSWARGPGCVHPPTGLHLQGHREADRAGMCEADLLSVFSDFPSQKDSKSDK